MKKLLPSEDILTYAFETKDDVSCTIVYADGVVDKQLLGDLIARPLSRLSLKNEGGMSALNAETVEKKLLFPELKQIKSFDGAVKAVLDGNSLL